MYEFYFKHDTQTENALIKTKEGMELKNFSSPSFLKAGHGYLSKAAVENVKYRTDWTLNKVLILSGY